MKVIENSLALQRSSWSQNSDKVATFLRQCTAALCLNMCQQSDSDGVGVVQQRSPVHQWAKRI